MKLRAVQRIVGLLAMLFSVTMLPPALLSLLYGDSSLPGFAGAFLIALAGGACIWYPVRSERSDLRVRDGFLVVVAFWFGLGLLGAVPLMWSGGGGLSPTDAVFESVSGLTTTGGTVIVGLDELPRAVQYYRQQLQWLGGMGIVVLAVAILPMLGVGGMQLYQAETPGPIKDTKLTPRITQTAKALWYIYLGLTGLCALAYWAAGMDIFDAIGHAFSTVSTGGFSNHDASLGHFNSPVIEGVAIIFMTAGGVNFSLHFMAFRALSVKPYLDDSEFRAYILWFSALAIATCGYLMLYRAFERPADAIMAGLFHVVSIGTSTGYTTTAFHAWPGFLPVMLILASFIGGSGGSTAGGIKVIRALLLVKQGVREVTRLIHPSAQIPIKLGQRVIPQRVIESVYGFFSAYVLIFGFMLLGLMATGLDQVTAFSAVAACLNNLGPGLGQVATSYATISDPAKWMLTLTMILGRLEIFTLLVLLSPAFWRR